MSISGVNLNQLMNLSQLSDTSQVSGSRDSDGSSGVHRAGQISYCIENVDHFYDDDVSYHRRYF